VFLRGKNFIVFVVVGGTVECLLTIVSITPRFSIQENFAPSKIPSAWYLLVISMPAQTVV
jgi:hypothetical protein